MVVGEPVTQGSKRSYVPRHPSTGQPYYKNGRIVSAVVEDNKEALASWRSLVADAARKHVGGCPHFERGSPLHLAIAFLKPRLKGHFGTGRNAGRLKSSAPDYPTTKPDLLKLARAVEDAMTGIVYVDDSQIVRESLEKLYSNTWGAIVTVSEMASAVETNGAGRGNSLPQRLLQLTTEQSQ